MTLSPEQVAELEAELKEIEQAEAAQQEHLARLRHALETTTAQLNALAGRTFQVQKWLEPKEEATP